MSKDACTPVCLCALSTESQFDSCEEVSSVIVVIYVSVSTFVLHCVSLCANSFER